MDSLLKEINMLPGVFGCFVYTAQQELAGTKLPPIFKENTVKTMGNLLTRSLKMGSMAHLDITGMEFKFDVSLLIIKPLSDGAMLAMICEPAVNRSLINMTLGMLINDIQKAILDGPRTQTSTTSTAQNTRPQNSNAPIPKTAVHKEADIDAALAPVLEKFKEALAYAIGPIAGQVMKDIIEAWAQNGSTTKQRLPELATLLCQEINDKELEKEFMDNIRHLF